MDDLRPDARNANRGTTRGAAMLEKSLRKHGAGRSILVDREGRVIAGNKTLENAQNAGMKEIIVVPSDGTKLVVVQRTDLDLSKDKSAKELAVADNRVSELSLEWNEEVLAGLKDEIELGEFFNEAELRNLIGDPEGDGDVPNAQFDRADELQAKWSTAAGQLWAMGKHLLICGDSTDAAVISALMNGEKAEMCFTDPPWNVAIGGDNNPRHRQRKGLQNDSMSQAGFAQFLNAIARGIERAVAGDVYCIMGCEQWPTLDAALRAAELHWSATVIWAKDLFVLGRSKYHRRYEPIWYGWPEGGKSSYCGGRDQDDVWEIPRPRTSEEHPTMKPIELVTRAIRNSSAHTGLVFDPFNGSGTTLLAAEKSGRVARCAEIDPRFVAVCLERAAEMGLKPKLVQRGRAAA
jgi:DNA modification methylase